ncbi:MAG: 5,6-dimethylbenzimidazole synthase [Rhodocyclales bacterium]|nr:5,6-dimethylbenzimidazole synthase [Rhodocyclales bacterium]
MNDYRYSDADIAAVRRAIEERRDVRHFRPDPLPAGLLERLIAAANLAPSVGYMQPWRFLHIQNRELRQRIHALVDVERAITAQALGERGADFLKLKVEGILDCTEVLVVALRDGRERHVFGRRTMPDMDLASVACAIQNMWLLARAEGIGIGWVSLYDPQELAALLGMPEGARPVAVLCIGHVREFLPRPMLEIEGWGQRRTMEDVLAVDRW